MPELLVIVVLLSVIFVVLTVLAALWIAVARLGWVSLLYLIVFIGAGTLTALLIHAANGTDAGAILGGLGAAYFAVKGVAYIRANRSSLPDAGG
jgi:hypothetical protein